LSSVTKHIVLVSCV